MYLFLKSETIPKLNNLILNCNFPIQFELIEKIINEKNEVDNSIGIIDFEVVSSVLCGEQYYGEGDIIFLNQLSSVDCTVHKIKDEYNHFPNQLGEWVDYTGYRYKMAYQVEDVTDKIHDGFFYPNGNYFSQVKGGNNDLEDSEVKRIRLVTEEECKEYGFNSKYSVESNFRVFKTWLLNERDY